MIGAGQAAVQAIDTLRSNGYQGSITLIGDEAELPYHRPPLSKNFLLGEADESKLPLRARDFYEANHVQCLLGRRAEGLDRTARRVQLQGGEEVPYDALLLATGGRPRRVAAYGAVLNSVHELRSLHDARSLRQSLGNARRVVIIGGGYIGLEAAAICSQLSLDVTIIELADRLLSRVTSAQISDFYRTEHERRGVRILCNTRVRAIVRDSASGELRAVICDDGTEVPADTILLCIGLMPADELARSAGLQCNDGIAVNEHCRSSDPAIFAAGDCANQFRPRYGLAVRLESVDNACEQGRVAALNILGTAAVSDKVPSFWSDQYDLSLVTVGLSRSYDDLVVRGSPSSQRFAVCYLRAGELVAIDAVNAPRDQLAARKLIDIRARPDLSKLQNPSIPLKECV